MSAQHMPGSIRYDYAPGYCGELIASDGHSVATFDDEPSPEDASRLVACWNACEGIQLDVLEAMPSGPAALLPMYARLETQRDELLKAVRSIAAITTCAGQDPEAMCAEIQGICRVALAACERGGKA